MRVEKRESGALVRSSAATDSRYLSRTYMCLRVRPCVRCIDRERQAARALSLHLACSVAAAAADRLVAAPTRTCRGDLCD